MRICLYRGKYYSGYYRFKKGYYGLADIPTIFQETIDRTSEYSTPAWLDDLIVVTKGDRIEHDKKLFDMLKKYRTNTGAEMTQKGWAEKEAEIQEDFIWGMGPEALYQIIRADYKTDPDKMATKDLFRPFK